VPRLVDLLREIFTLRQELLTHPHPYPGLESDLGALLPSDFLGATPYGQLPEVPRYLRAMKVRADRWRDDPERDTRRAGQLAPYLKAVSELRADIAASEPGRHFRRLIEEYRVSLFAQSLGTSEPVSAAKLDRELAALCGTEAAPKEAPPRPASIAKGPGRLKSLGALERLFPKE
jgi:ATP-dependent RNA helicase HrpA